MNKKQNFIERLEKLKNLIDKLFINDMSFEYGKGSKVMKSDFKYIGIMILELQFDNELHYTDMIKCNEIYLKYKDKKE